MKAIHPADKATIVFGAGRTARQVAEKVTALGSSAVLVTGDRPEAGADAETLQSTAPISLLADTELETCRGQIGDFTLELRQNGKSRLFHAAHVVVAEPERRTANFSLYGLAPSDAVISLSDLKTLLADPAAFGRPATSPAHLVFLHGITAESTPAIAEEVMTAAIGLQLESGVQTYVLTGNLKVAGNGLEELYRRSKEAGVFYVKFTDTAPDVRQQSDGAVVVEFVDEVTHQRFSIRPGLTVVDETIRPAKSLARLARALDLEVDETGFAQADNVHRWTVGTNRRGVLAVGAARGIVSEEEKRTDAVNAAAAIARFTATPADDRARIEPGLCIRCLTCYRLCPYRAIRITDADRVEVMAESCERCGICAAECPRTAVRIPGLDREMGIEEKAPSTGAGASITAFCCSRSALPANDLARRMGRPLPEGLSILQVPCAGAVSLQHIMTAFSRGADGVMILSCHPDNCHSRAGNAMARQRADLLGDRLAFLGVDPRRLAVRTLASNMGVEFSEAVQEFEKTLSSTQRNDPRQTK